MKSSLLTTASLVKVFVYGTLKPGEGNYQHYCAGRVHSQADALVEGNLYHLPVGYPAMTAGKGCTRGILLTFNQPNILTQLDRLEGYQPGRPDDFNEYCRLAIPIYGQDNQPLGEAWAYFMNKTKVIHYGGTIVESGCWSSQEYKGNYLDLT